MEEQELRTLSDTDGVVGGLVQKIKAVLGVDIASVAILDSDRNVFQMSQHAGVVSEEYRNLSILPGTGLGGLVVELEQPVRLDDYVTSREISDDYRPVVLGEGLRSMACVPVKGLDGTTLLLYAGNRSDRLIDDRTLGRLEGLALAAQQDIGNAAWRNEARRIVLEDRARIAGALHDTVAQVLFAIAVDAEAPDATGPAGQPRLDRIAEMAREGRRDLRRTFAWLTGQGQGADGDPAPGGVVAGVHPLVGASPLVGLQGLQPLGALGGLTGDRPEPRRVLAEVLEESARACGDRLGIHVVWVEHDPWHEAPEPVCQFLKDCAGEGLRNASKHGGATEAIVTLSGSTERVSLSVQSMAPAGVGALPEEFEEGSGLGMLRGRARALGGDLELKLHDDSLDGGVDSVTVALRLVLPRRVGARS